METVITPTTPRSHSRGGVKFGTRLRKARAERGLSLEDAAQGMGIWASTLHRLETGERGAGFSIAQAISAFYAIPLNDLQQDATN